MKISLGLFFTLVFSTLYGQLPRLIAKGSSPDLYVVHVVSPTDTYRKLANLYNQPSDFISGYNELSFHDSRILSRTLNIPLTARNFVQRGSGSNNSSLVPVYAFLDKTQPLEQVSNRFKVPASLLRDWNELSPNEENVQGLFKIGYLKLRNDVVRESKKRETSTRDEEPSPPPLAVRRIIEKEEPPVRPAIEKKEIAKIAKPRQEEVEQPKEEPAEELTDVETSFQNDIEASPPPNRLKVHVLCTNTKCDHLFLSKEISNVDFSASKDDCDIYVLIRSRRKKGGGKEFQLIVHNQTEFDGKPDTLTYSLERNSTSEEEKSSMARYLKQGLSPFVEAPVVEEKASDSSDPGIFKLVFYICLGLFIVAAFFVFYYVKKTRF